MENGSSFFPYGSLGSSISLLSLPCLMIQCETAFIKICFLFFRIAYFLDLDLEHSLIYKCHILHDCTAERHSIPEPHITK